jgi:hypothetical protein
MANFDELNRRTSEYNNSQTNVYNTNISTGNKSYWLGKANADTYKAHNGQYPERREWWKN